eukprot:185498_1
MGDLQRFYKLYQQNSDIANFVIIYIKEAHGSDMLFTLEGNINIKTPQYLNERKIACKKMIDLMKENINDDTFDYVTNNNNENGIKIVIDNMKNEMLLKFLAYPERLFVIDNYKVVFQQEAGPHAYNVGEVEEFLNNYRKCIENN